MVPIPSWRVGRERLWFGPQDGRVQAHAEVSESEQRLFQLGSVGDTKRARAPLSRRPCDYAPVLLIGRLFQ